MYAMNVQKTFESLDKLRERILSRLSHELRTPVTSITGYAEVLLSEPTMQAETRQEFLGIIKEEGDRLTSLVDGLMELFALERGSITLNLSEADIIDIVNSAIKAVSREAEEKSLTITPFYDQRDISASVDSDRMFEAILHILVNAVKFSPTRGDIIVAVRSAGHTVEIMISDNGQGIPTHEVELVFRGLYRVNRTGEEVPGVGMGLAIAKHLLELHSGRIRFMGGENKGSIFVLTFPTHQDIDEQSF